MASTDVLIICESEAEARLLRMILRAVHRAEHTTIHAVGMSPTPQMLLSAVPASDGSRGGILGSIRRRAHNFAGALIVFDLDFGSPIQPAPYAAQLSDFWLVPAVPGIEAWILADDAVFNLMASDPRHNLNQSFKDYIADSTFHFFNSKFIAALSRKRIEEVYNPYRAALLSPSLRAFLKTLDHVQGTDASELEFTLPGSIVANLVLEYYPSELPLYRTLDGSVYTGREMAEEIAEGTAIGRKYSSDLLRVCRDLLARQAQNVRAAE